MIRQHPQFMVNCGLSQKGEYTFASSVITLPLRSRYSRSTSTHKGRGVGLPHTRAPTIFSLGKMFGHRNEQNQLLSCAGVIQYDGHAVIGLVIVHPSCQGMGLGRSLMLRCMEEVPAEVPIMLIATPQGQPLYEKLGFTVVDSIHKYICERYTSVSFQNQLAQLETGNIVPMGPADVEAVIQLDAQATGSLRADFVRARMKQAKSCVVATDASSGIIGYGFSIPGPVHLIAGPIVAANHLVASRIIDQLASQHEGSIRIDVPAENASFLTQLEACGFVKSSQPPVMIARTCDMPKRNGTYYGIASQFLG